MNKDLGNDKIPILLLEQAIPAILSMIVAAIYNVVDRIFIGRLNPLGLTAVGITMPFQVVQMAFVLLIGIGGASLISIKLGEKKIEEAEKILANSLILFVITEVFLTVICLLFIDNIFEILKVPKSTYQLAKDYIIIILIGGIPGLTGYCLNNAVRGLGFSKESMFFVITSSILNIILDALFILYFGWGVKGAAIATVISQTLVTYYVIKFFLKNKKSPISIHFSRLKLEYKIVKEIVSNGMPNFYMQIVGTIVGVLFNRIVINLGGDIELASITIISSIGLFFSMFYYGISSGSQPIIGYNFGANKIERSQETLKYGFLFIIVISVIFMMLIEIYPEQLIRMFTKDEELISLTSQNMRVYLLGLPLIGIHSVSSTYFISIKKPKISSILNILRYGAILIPTVYILTSIIGIKGIYISNALNDIVSGLVALAFIYIYSKKGINNGSLER